MKKNVLLILLSAFALTGCELDLGFIKFGSNDNTEQKEDRKDENSNEKPGENENPSGQSGDNTTPSTGDNTGGDKPELDKEYTVEIALAGSTFCSKVGIKGTGVQINEESGANNKAKFDSYLSESLEYDGLLTSTVCQEMNTAQYGDSFCICLGTRNDYAETGFDEGVFTWNSAKNIKKVEVKARGYYKALGYKDVNARLAIDGQETSLAYDASSEPEHVTVSKEYSSDVKSFTLKSSYGRVTFESIKITWSV